MTPKEVLKEAKNLLQSPNHWVQGISRMRLDNDETAFCSVGALGDINCSIDTLETAMDYLNSAAYSLSGIGAVYFNDSPHRQHSEILEMFDLAISYCQD